MIWLDGYMFFPRKQTWRERRMPALENKPPFHRGSELPESSTDTSMSIQ